MSEELPYALLQCAVCDTSLRVTLKKGRVPSKPIPCPTCKEPIRVTEDDIHAGKKTGGVKMASSDLRSTRVAKLRATQEVDEETLAAAASLAQVAEVDDPSESDVSVEIAMVQPDEAEEDESEGEVDEASSESLAAPSDPAPELSRDSVSSDTPPFGVIVKKGEGTKRTSSTTEDDLSLTVGSKGVHVVKVDRASGRDDVFGSEAPKGSSGARGAALGRIGIKRVRADSLPVRGDDPDLPAPAPPKADEGSTGSKLDLSRLKSALRKLDEDGPKSDAVEVGVGELDFDIGEADIDDAFDSVSEASEGQVVPSETGVQTSEASDLALDSDADEMELPEFDDIDEGFDIASELSSAEEDLISPRDDVATDSEASEPLEAAGADSEVSIDEPVSERPPEPARGASGASGTLDAAAGSAAKIFIGIVLFLIFAAIGMYIAS